MSPAFTNKLLYTTETKLPQQFLDEIKIHIENDTLFHSAINTDEIDKRFRSSRNGWIQYGFYSEGNSAYSLDKWGSFDPYWKKKFGYLQDLDIYYNQIRFICAENIDEAQPSSPIEILLGAIM